MSSGGGRAYRRREFNWGCDQATPYGLAEDRLHPIAETILLELEHTELLPVGSGLRVFQLWEGLRGWLEGL